MHVNHRKAAFDTPSPFHRSVSAGPERQLHSPECNQSLSLQDTASAATDRDPAWPAVLESSPHPVAWLQQVFLQLRSPAVYHSDQRTLPVSDSEPPVLPETVLRALLPQAGSCIPGCSLPFAGLQYQNTPWSRFHHPRTPCGPASPPPGRTDPESRRVWQTGRGLLPVPFVHNRNGSKPLLYFQRHSVPRN